MTDLNNMRISVHGAICYRKDGSAHIHFHPSTGLGDYYATSVQNAAAAAAYQIITRIDSCAETDVSKLDTLTSVSNATWLVVGTPDSYESCCFDITVNDGNAAVDMLYGYKKISMNLGTKWDRKRNEFARLAAIANNKKNNGTCFYRFEFLVEASRAAHDRDTCLSTISLKKKRTAVAASDAFAAALLSFDLLQMIKNKDIAIQHHSTFNGQIGVIKIKVTNDDATITYVRRRCNKPDEIKAEFTVYGLSGPDVGDDNFVLIQKTPSYANGSDDLHNEETIAYEELDTDMNNTDNKQPAMKSFMSFDGFGKVLTNNAVSLYFRHLGLGEIYAETCMHAGIVAAQYAINNHTEFSELYPDGDFSPEISPEMLQRNKKYAEECAKLAQDPNSKYKPCSLTVIKCADGVMRATLVFNGKTHHLGEITKHNPTDAQSSPFNITIVVPKSTENDEMVFRTAFGDIRAESEIAAAAFTSVYIASKFKNVEPVVFKICENAEPIVVKTYEGDTLGRVQIQSPGNGYIQATYVDSTIDYGNTLAEFMLHPVTNSDGSITYVAEQTNLVTSTEVFETVKQRTFSVATEKGMKKFIKDVGTILNDARTDSNLSENDYTSDDLEEVDTSDDDSRLVPDYEYTDFLEYTYNIAYINPDPARNKNHHVVVVDMGCAKVRGFGRDRKEAYCAAYRSVKAKVMCAMTHGHIVRPSNIVSFSACKSLGKVTGYGHMTVTIPIVVKNSDTEER